MCSCGYQRFQKGNGFKCGQNRHFFATGIVAAIFLLSLVNSGIQWGNSFCNFVVNFSGVNDDTDACGCVEWSKLAPMISRIACVASVKQSSQVAF